LPDFGRQLPFSPATLPGVGSKPGQHFWVLDGFLREDADRERLRFAGPILKRDAVVRGVRDEVRDLA
jgi:hypothetical protein